MVNLTLFFIKRYLVLYDYLVPLKYSSLSVLLLVVKSSETWFHNKYLTPTSVYSTLYYYSMARIRQHFKATFCTILFFLCIRSRVTLNIIEMMMASKVNRCGEEFCPPMLLMCAVPFTHLMLVLNSSANIVIYCLLGDGFRYVIWKL